MMGMFTPELVLWCSLNQYMEARVLHKRVRAIHSHRHRRQPPDNPIELANQAPLPTTSGVTLMFEDFSMKLAFFVLMGGYAHDFAPEDPKILPKTITPQGFISLCKDSKIKQHYLDVKLIEDKSKADGLAKFLVCMQALVSIYPPRVAPILNPFAYLNFYEFCNHY